MIDPAKLVDAIEHAFDAALAAVFAELDSDTADISVLASHARTLDRALSAAARRSDAIDEAGLSDRYAALKRRAEVWQLPLRRAGTSIKATRQSANMDRLRRLAQLEQA